MKKTVMMIGLCLTMIVAVTLTPGCSGTKTNSAVVLPQNLAELSLAEVWGAVVKTIDIQESADANLESMSFRALNGKVRQFYFSFFVPDDAGATMYNVFFDEKGRLEWFSGQITNGIEMPPTFSPKIVFTEIDKFGLMNIRTDVSGFTIDVSARKNVEYTSNIPFPLYRIEDGLLTPLEHVKLSSERPGLPVQVGSIAIDEPPKGHYETYAMPEYWFLGEDLDRAETLTYPDAQRA